MAGEPGRLWLEVSVLAPPRGQELMLVDALRRAGARLVEREGDRLRAHLLTGAGTPATPAAASDLLRQVEAAVRASTTLPDPALSWRWRTGPPEPVERRGAAGVQRVSDGIVVVRRPASPADPPPTARPEAPLVIRLEPGVAFGGADHPTTRACLRRLETLVEPRDRLVDIGAGSGVLSIAAALFGARRVLALEADAEACEEARRNAALNGVARQVRVRHQTTGPRQLRRMRGYHGIVANLQAEILRPLLPGVRHALAPGGWLLISGVTRPEQQEIAGAAAAAGLEPEAQGWDEGWWTATLRRRSGAE